MSDMNLINIVSQVIGAETIQTVNARELHEFLEVGCAYGAWIKRRIEKYEFVENQDFAIRFPNLKSGLKGGQNKTDYFISLDMAKELSMVENNERGRQARKYFVDCEKKLKEMQPRLPNFNDPVAAARAWADAEEGRLLAIQQVEEQAPKVEHYDAVLNTSSTKSIGEVAKFLGFKFISNGKERKIGQNILFQVLRNCKLLMQNNQPYQQHINSGIFQLKETTKDINGEVKVFSQTRVTQYGIDFIRHLLIALGCHSETCTNEQLCAKLNHKIALKVETVVGGKKSDKVIKFK